MLLQSEISALKEAALSKNPEASDTFSSQENSDIQTLKESWETEKAGLLAEISVLKISLDDLRRDQQSATNRKSVDENTTSQRQISTLEVKSEEKAESLHLKHSTEPELSSLKNDQLSLQQDLIASAISATQDALTAQIEALRAEIQEKEEGWSKEKEKLTSDIASVTRSKDDAIQEGAFFREHYARISAQVNVTSQENEELLKRAQRAEKQVISGLAILRADFKGRVEKLTEELNKSKGVVALLTEKDRRTNDTIRQKAASVPALIARIKNLEEESRMLREDMGNLLRHRDDIEVERAQLNASLSELGVAHEKTLSENKRMNIAILRYKAMERYFLVELSLSASLDDTEPDAEGEVEAPEEEEVYKCEWHIDEETGSCGEVFRTKQVCFNFPSMLNELSLM